MVRCRFGEPGRFRPPGLSGPAGAPGLALADLPPPAHPAIDAALV